MVKWLIDQWYRECWRGCTNVYKSFWFKFSIVIEPWDLCSKCLNEFLKELIIHDLNVKEWEEKGIYKCAHLFVLSFEINNRYKDCKERGIKLIRRLVHFNMIELRMW